jgi:long-chain acyl-CoA synthetase
MIGYTKKQIKELDAYFKHPRNLVDLFEDSVRKWGNRNAIGTKNTKTKVYEWATYSDLAARIDNLRGGLKKIGFKKGETVGVIVSNSAEWFIIENATHGLGGCFVAMYEKELEKIWHYIIKDAKIKYLFVRNEAIADRLKEIKKKISTLKEVFIIYGDGPKSMGSLEEIGKKNPVKSYKP